jgi:hypothetical protein
LIQTFIAEAYNSVVDKYNPGRCGVHTRSADLEHALHEERLCKKSGWKDAHGELVRAVSHLQGAEVPGIADLFGLMTEFDGGNEDAEEGEDTSGGDGAGGGHFRSDDDGREWREEEEEEAEDYYHTDEDEDAEEDEGAISSDEDEEDTDSTSCNRHPNGKPEKTMILTKMAVTVNLDHNGDVITDAAVATLVGAKVAVYTAVVLPGVQWAHGKEQMIEGEFVPVVILCYLPGRYSFVIRCRRRCWTAVLNAESPRVSKQVCRRGCQGELPRPNFW